METINSTQEAPIVTSTAQWNEEMARFAKRTVPSFFPIKARLPKQGRTNQVLGATTHMSVVLKTYASGGENEIHAHSNEDHVFVILQGGAVFFGPKDERKEAHKNDCILIPRNAFYRFHALEEEPLVMLRIGAAIDPAKDVLARIDLDGAPFDGHSEKNKEVPLILEEDKWFK